MWKNDQSGASVSRSFTCRMQIKCDDPSGINQETRYENMKCSAMLKPATDKDGESSSSAEGGETIRDENHPLNLQIQPSLLGVLLACFTVSWMIWWQSHPDSLVFSSYFVGDITVLKFSKGHCVTSWLQSIDVLRCLKRNLRQVALHMM